MPQPCQHPPAHQEYREFRFRLIFQVKRPGRDDRNRVMRCHFLVRTLQFRLVAVGLGHPDPRIVRHQNRRRMTVKRQHPHVATEPVR